MKIRIIFALFVSKFLITLGKIMNKESSSTPGKIALWLCPEILSFLSKQVKEEIICMCGTNGKTTTSNLLYGMIKNSGKKVICNLAGANMVFGVACAFVNESSFFGKIEADYAVMECDEASLRHIVKHFSPSKIVITNLFRDQLDRFGEIDITIKLLKEAFSSIKDFKLVLNADDPLSSYFGTIYPAYYYGIANYGKKNTNEIKEGRFCLCCGEELKYEYYHYSQLGKYVCPKCSFKRPEPQYEAINISLNDGMNFAIKTDKNSFKNVNVNYKGFYNIYNIIASYAVFADIIKDDIAFDKTLSEYKPQVGRMETFVINNKNVTLNLSKNPAGMNQAISTLSDDTSEKDIYIVLNDLGQDGKDISWIWDVDYEFLKNANIKNVWASGIRKDDMALRLHYADIPIENVCNNTIENIKEFIYSSNRPCYILVNYTALYPTHNILKKLEK